MDPLIRRFYEPVRGYEPTIKPLINEEFGDAIMSAIDFNLSVQREPDPEGKSRAHSDVRHVPDA